MVMTGLAESSTVPKTTNIRVHKFQFLGSFWDHINKVDGEPECENSGMSASSESLALEKEEVLYSKRPRELNHRRTCCSPKDPHFQHRQQRAMCNGQAAFSLQNRQIRNQERPTDIFHLNIKPKGETNVSPCLSGRHFCIRCGSLIRYFIPYMHIFPKINE